MYKNSSEHLSIDVRCFGQTPSPIFEFESTKANSQFFSFSNMLKQCVLDNLATLGKPKVGYMDVTKFLAPQKTIARLFD